MVIKEKLEGIFFLRRNVISVRDNARRERG
jgi:hypothetical protein